MKNQASKENKEKKTKQKSHECQLIFLKQPILTRVSAYLFLLLLWSFLFGFGFVR